MRIFLTIWIGQTLSLVGSGITGFAMAVWVFEQTGSVTHLALISFCTQLPMVLFSPIAGVLVDRWDRRHALIISDSVAALCTFSALLLLSADNLQITYIYIIVFIVSTFNTLQYPAYAASMPLLVPEGQLGRANSLTQLSVAGSQLIAPILGGVLVSSIGLAGVFVIDIASFLIALLCLLIVRIPRPRAEENDQSERRSIRDEIAVGWGFVRSNSGLLLLAVFFGLNNFVEGIMLVLIKPIVLSFASAATLGMILSIAGLGLLVGSVVMGVWGGPRRLVRGMLLVQLIAGLAFVFAGLRASILFLAIGTFIYNFTVPIYLSCHQTFWQKVTPAEIQGRVFSLLTVISRGCLPIAYLVSGPLADRFFQPAMAADGWLASSFGVLLGTGPGRGYGLMFFVFGLLTIAITFLVLLHPAVRGLDRGTTDRGEQEPTPSADTD
jgi:MFS family permease